MTGNRRRWISALVIAWAVVLALFALLPVGDDATVPEHRSATQARPVVDRAAAETIRAAGPGVAVTVTGYQLRRRCSVAQFRDGGDFMRIVRLYTAPGSVRDLLRRLEQTFSNRYDTRRYSKSGAFRVDVGEFVTLSAAPANQTDNGDTDNNTDATKDTVKDTAESGKDSGEVQVTITTGCRPIDEPVTTFHTAPSAADRERATLLLRALHLTAESWHVSWLPCPDGGTMRTVSATASATPTSPRLTSLGDAVPTSATVVIQQPTLLAFRDGGVSTVAKLSGKTLTVSSTVDCG